ncbi:DEKNAAC104836 [Brettanomyces naardenensis]|uniref:DNA-(apurinic or apyrimidinic site) endonuclease 2 n=1 Tax=Brettanomyces naardenensis TaxID=13370 RepID=A0A448YSE4_BRENA|nr:DEKNAAC104836 [Brettanomyces naardenensis]
MTEIENENDNEPAEIPEKYSETSLRLVSYNVNGIKTLKNYSPWNERPGYDDAFRYMKADVVTFQELKLQRSDIDASIANPSGYLSFITVPQSKKGYSGVGVFVRKPCSNEPDIIKQALTVRRAEEGITGFLHMRGARQSYRDCLSDDKYRERCIGGYPSLDDPVQGRHLDSEGRCIVLELGIGLVVISVYCPANSMCTVEGEDFRLLFLQCLFERAENLLRKGKQVVIMGDINVSPNLIDSDEYISDGFEKGTLIKPNEVSEFEAANREEVLKYKTCTESKGLLNGFTFDNTGLEEENRGHDKILHDVTRELQGRRMKMYTVWNTLKNNRPQNIGSRIDLFLATSGIASSAKGSDIWPFLYGSDHCPIYCDFDLESKAVKELAESSKYGTRCNCKHLDAKNYYCVGNSRSIDSFFRKPEKHAVEEEEEGHHTKKEKTTEHTIYVSRKRGSKEQSSLFGFFSVGKTARVESVTEVRTLDATSSSSLFVTEDEDGSDSEAAESHKKISVQEFRKLLQTASCSTIPLCRHHERCAFRTVKSSNSGNVGKKFWCCARRTKSETWDLSKDDGLRKADGGEALDEYNCGYFKWATK